MTKTKVQPQELIKEIKLVSYWDEHYYEIALLNGEKRFIPSVTNYLNALNKEWLPRFRGEVGNREADLRLNEAADRGSRLHHAFMILARGGVVLFQHPEWKNPDPELKEQAELLVRQCKANNIPVFVLHNQDEMIQVNRVVTWYKVLNPSIEASELIVYSLKHKFPFAGTLDLKISIEGGSFPISGADPLELSKGRYIVDFKTGAEDESHELQAAAYIIADEECYNERIDGALIVYTNAKTKKGIEGLKTIFLNREQIDRNFQTFQQVQEVWHFQHPNDQPKVFAFNSVAYRATVEPIIEQIKEQ